MCRTTAEPWPADTDAGLLGVMRAGADTALKDLAAIRALGDQLGVALPWRRTERRTDRVFGFPGE